MQHRVIPLVPWSDAPARRAFAVITPEAAAGQGDTPRVLATLRADVARALAEAAEPAIADDGWLAGLKLRHGEAWLALQPLPPSTTRVVAQAAFETLRRLLPDTDIFVGRTPRH